MTTSSRPYWLRQLDHQEQSRRDEPVLIEGERRITWGQLAQRSNALAAALRAEGIGRDQPVALIAGNSIEYVETLLGILKAGACAVPLSTLLDSTSLRTLLQDADPAAIFATPAHQEKAQCALGDQAPGQRALLVAMGDGGGPWRALAEFVAPWADETPDVEINDADLFNIIYSSGTTGTPKGIEHDHAFRSWQCRETLDWVGIDRNAVGVFPLPLYSNASLGGVFPFLAAGARLIIMPSFDEEQFLRLCEDARPTHVFLVPAILQRLLASPDLTRRSLSPDTFKWVGTAPFSAEYKRAVLRQWPGPFMETYGMTEGGPMFALRVDHHPDKLDTVGLPIGGTEALILDDNDHPCATGEVGEVVGWSPTIMRGYHNRPDLTAQMMYTDAKGKPHLRTGDLGFLDEDGFLHIVGRRKDMIISGGQNVYPSDIEAVIAAHEAVADVAVVGVDSERWGETPFAFVVPRDGAAPDLSELVHWTNARLAKYQRIAGAEICTELPRNALGKILKRELREKVLEKKGRLP